MHWSILSRRSETVGEYHAQSVSITGTNFNKFLLGFLNYGQRTIGDFGSSPRVLVNRRHFGIVSR
jgi:hypothetical protein